MTDHSVLDNLLIIFTVSIAVVFLFHQFRLPSIAGFLVAGVVIGPHGLNLISDIETVQILAEIGIVLLLFTIGIEFSLVQMASLRKLLLVAAPIQVGGVIALVWLGGILAGLPGSQAIFWGFLLSLSSTAIVLLALSASGESDSVHGRATIGILVFQDLAVVPMILLVPILASPSGDALTSIFWTLSKSLIVVALIVAAAWYVVPKILEHIVRSRSRELFLLTIIVMCLGIAWLTSLSGLSLALGAFIAGLVISESEYSHQATAEVLPFRDSFNSLFFVSIGILMDWRILLHYPGIVTGLLLVVLLVKFVSGAGAVLAASMPPRAAIMTGIALAQVGEFSFILAQVGQEHGLLSGTPYQIFLAVSVCSMVITPFLIQASPHLARHVEAVQRLHRWLPGHTTAHVLEMEGRHLRVRDHVIIVGYGLNGRNLARVLSETEIPYVVLDLDGDIVRREAKLGLPLYYGDATNPNILRHVKIEAARVLVVAIPDPFTARRTVQIARTLNPKIHIVVRTRYLRELEELHQIGADDVVPEEFETSIEIFALVLRTYNMPPDFVMQKAEQVRREGYALLRRSELPELAHHLRRGTLSDVDVETCRIEEDSPASGKTIDQLALWQRTGVSIVALTRNGVTESNPSVKTKLLAGDIVVLLGTREQIRRAMALLLFQGEAG
ncbi:cation:proton antiporter domain-containing protein [Candidatus Nitrospira inopinata]|jgi:CPA2 family monovalent cation:H+ antiporter-2|uniref:Putative Glutathione-regulated potassium-efflux system n=1 Tax=Candidatus Nitrospira inopinata TaxID=1715989 RepID=A0A0S4KTJ7_9BACT|nr:cation:proton antiporter [Candidatus Nitrospira inopinata]CUQ66621.1 putative Glutathione-regulated potassium-efflux system [Candidatus Nitrospira inopinata]